MNGKEKKENKQVFQWRCIRGEGISIAKALTTSEYDSSLGELSCRYYFDGKIRTNRSHLYYAENLNSTHVQRLIQSTVKVNDQSVPD